MSRINNHLLALAHNDRVQQVGLVPQVGERRGDAVENKEIYYTRYAM